VRGRWRALASIALAGIVFAVFGCGGGTRCDRPPVLMLHGYGGGAATFDPLIEGLVGDGWSREDLAAPDLPAGVSIERWGRLAAADAASMHARRGCRVAIVGYSMGGLAARWAAGQGGAAPHLRAVITVGAPNHGTPIADTCEEPPCLEMRAGSAFLAALDGPRGGAGVPVVSIASATDRVVAPASARLEGARNVTFCCPPHNRMLRHDGVIRAVRDALAAPEGKGP
jgi:triacylglycerol lipase